MAERRHRVNVGEDERRVVREAHREHPNNPELRMDWILNNAQFNRLPQNIQEVYADRHRATRRVRDIVRRELNDVVNERIRNRRRRRVQPQENRAPENPPNIWRPWGQPINHENNAVDIPPPAPYIQQQPPNNIAAGHEGRAGERLEVPAGIHQRRREQPRDVLPDDVVGVNIELPEVPREQGGRREQLYTLLRRNAKTTDRLLNGRLIQIMDAELRVLALLERRLNE